MYSLVYSLTYLLVYSLTYSLVYSLTFFQRFRKLRIQEGHFLKIALNLDLTLPDDGECPALLISCGIIDLGAFCVELWSFFVSKRISVPMSYIWTCLRVATPPRTPHTPPPGLLYRVFPEARRPDTGSAARGTSGRRFLICICTYIDRCVLYTDIRVVSYMYVYMYVVNICAYNICI